MNKDALLATAIGFAVGLIITSIVLFGPSASKNVKFPRISFTMPSFLILKKPTPTPTPNPEDGKKSHFISIDSPLPNSLETAASILVSGTTTPNAVVVVSGGIDDVVVNATDDGKYAGKITLTEGKNTITTTSIDAEKKQAEQTVIVFYTTETL